jgi:hypothetical protein
LSGINCMVAICMNLECGAVHAQQPPNGTHHGQGFILGRSDVIFVTTVPYHVSLGGEVGRILSEDNFAKPGVRYKGGVIDVVRM